MGALIDHESAQAGRRRKLRGTYPDFFPFQSVPVNTPEPRVVEHILCPANEVPQSFGTIWVEEGLDELLGQPVHLLGPINPSPQDLFVDSRSGLVEEWREPDHHFISEDTTCPPVSRFPVTLV